MARNTSTGTMPLLFVVMTGLLIGLVIVMQRPGYTPMSAQELRDLQSPRHETQRRALQRAAEDLQQQLNALKPEISRFMANMGDAPGGDGPAQKKPSMEHAGVHASPVHRLTRVEKESLTYHEHRDKTTGESIFVSIVSFRDPDCRNTLRDLFQRALKPHRVFVGVVEQHDGEDSCMPPEFNECSVDKFCGSDQIRLRRMKPSKAKGATMARYAAAKMYRGEKYFMLIDSHNRFVSHWDERAVSLLKAAPSKNPALSHYPVGYTGQTSQQLDAATETTHMCTAKFNQNGILRFDGHRVPVGEGKLADMRFRPQPWASTGFLFTHGINIQHTPFDPHLPFLFDGEEMLLSVRLWTAGVDFFSPPQNIVFHTYARPGAKLVFSEPSVDWQQPIKLSIARTQFIMGLVSNVTRKRFVGNDVDPKVSQDVAHYGLGHVRTMSEYWQYAGVDPVAYTVDRDWCKVPWRPN